MIGLAGRTGLINRIARAKALAGKPPKGLGPGPGPGAAAPGGGANAGAGNGPNKKPGFHPFQALKEMEAGKVLTPQQLARGARALTVLETRPEIHGYKQIAKQLGQERDLQSQGLENLGKRTSGNVSSVYKDIAASEAQNLARQQALGEQFNNQAKSIASEGSQSLVGMQKGVLGDEAAQQQLRGAPGGGEAQQALANAVAAQQAHQAQDAEASRNYAASQAASYNALGMGMAGATQMQGGETVGQIGRDIIGRTAESNQKFNANIQTALGKLSEAKASFGPKETKNLLALREGENKLRLGQEAVQGNKAKLGLEGQKLREEQRQNSISNKISQQNANTSETSAHASLINAMVNKWEAEHPNASSGAAGKHRQEVKQEVREVRSLIPSLVGAYGSPLRPPKGVNPQKALSIFTVKMNEKASANPTIVARVLQHWFQNQQKKERAAEKHVAGQVRGTF